MRQKKRKKKIMLISTLATAALIIGGLTFAWYTSRDSVTNTFKTSGNLKTVVVENFTPPTNWQPGVTTDKVVQITNTGTIDAYTRVRLDEVLTYYKKGDALALNGTNTVSDYSETAVPYVQVDAEAIEKTVETWNAAHESSDDGTYVQLTAKQLTDDYGVPESVASNLVIYMKTAKADSTDADGKEVENGNNYEFIGYYDTGLVEKGSSNTVDETTTNKKICYELNIVPTIHDTESVADGVTTSATKTDITHTKSITLDCSIYKATKVVVDKNNSTKSEENISTYIELEFNTAGTSNQSDWYYLDGYYYYRGILPSGQSTTPLLKAVRMRDDVGNDVINATYELTVVSDSTQAVEEAFEGTWGLNSTNYSTIITNLASNPTTASNIARPTTKSSCEYDKENKLELACSNDLNGLIGASRTHDATVVAGARQTASESGTEAASVSSNNGENNEDNSTEGSSTDAS
jgi:alternate signal-mediated exported protein